MRLGKPGDAVSTSGSVMRQIINEQLQISESNPIKARYYDYDRFTYPWHFHSQYEIIYVKKSCGRCFVGDCIERFSEGDVVLFGPSLPHYMRSDDAYHGDNPRLRVQGTIIQFEENFMQYSFDHYPQFHQIRVLLKEARRGVVFHTADAGPVRDMVSAFPELKGFGQITGLLDLLQALAVSLPRRMLASPCYYEKFPTAGNKRIDKIISFINSNYTCMNSPPCAAVGDTVCKLPSLSKPLTALTFPCCLSKTSSTSFSCPSAGGVILFAINNWNFSGYGNSPAQR